jgi:hypothetical protein
VALGLLAVARDGTLRLAPRFEVPKGQDWSAQLGPDGTAYLFAYPNAATGDTEITAFDLGGVRQGWLARVTGRPFGFAFGPDGRLYVTEGQEDGRPSRILVFDRDGVSLPIGSEALPVGRRAPTGARAVCGPPPPIVAEDGSSFLVSEEGTTVTPSTPPGT